MAVNASIQYEVTALDKTKPVLEAIARNFKEIGDQTNLIPTVARGAIERIGARATDKILEAASGFYEAQSNFFVDGIASAQKQFNQLTIGAAGLAAASDMGYQESIDELDMLSSKLGKIAAKLPGSNEEYITSLNALSDDVSAAARNIDGSFDKAYFEENALKLSEANTVLAKGIGMDASMAAGFMTKLAGGQTGLNSVLKSDVFEKNVSFKNALLRSLEEQNIATDDWGKIEARQRLKIINDAYAKSFPQEAKDRLANSVEGTMEGFKSGLFDPIEGSLSFSRKINGKSTFDRFGVTVKQIFGEQGLIAQLSRINPFKMDTMKDISTVLDFLNKFLTGLNNFLIKIPTIDITGLMGRLKSLRFEDVGGYLYAKYKLLRIELSKAFGVSDIPAAKPSQFKIPGTSITVPIPKMAASATTASVKENSSKVGEGAGLDISGHIKSFTNSVKSAVAWLAEQIKTAFGEIAKSLPSMVANIKTIILSWVRGIGSMFAKNDKVQAIGNKIERVDYSAIALSVKTTLLEFTSEFSAIFKKIDLSKIQASIDNIIDPAKIAQVTLAIGIGISVLISTMFKLLKPAIRIITAGLVNFGVGLTVGLILSFGEIVSSVALGVADAVSGILSTIISAIDLAGFGWLGQVLMLLGNTIDGIYRVIVLPFALVGQFLDGVAKALNLPGLSSAIASMANVFKGKGLVIDVVTAMVIALIGKYVYHYTLLFIDSVMGLKALRLALVDASIITIKTAANSLDLARTAWQGIMWAMAAGADAAGMPGLATSIRNFSGWMAAKTEATILTLRSFQSATYWHELRDGLARFWAQMLESGRRAGLQFTGIIPFLQSAFVVAGNSIKAFGAASIQFLAVESLYFQDLGFMGYMGRVKAAALAFKASSMAFIINYIQGKLALVAEEIQAIAASRVASLQYSALAANNRALQAAVISARNGNVSAEQALNIKNLALESARQAVIYAESELVAVQAVNAINEKANIAAIASVTTARQAVVNTTNAARIAAAEVEMASLAGVVTSEQMAASVTAQAAAARAAANLTVVEANAVSVGATFAASTAAVVEAEAAVVKATAFSIEAATASTTAAVVSAASGASNAALTNIGVASLKIAGAFGSTAGFIIGISNAFIGVFSFLSGLVPVITGLLAPILGGGLALAIAPVIVVVGFIALVIGVLWLFWDDIVELFSVIWEGISSVAVTIWEAFKPLIDGLLIIGGWLKNGIVLAFKVAFAPLALAFQVAIFVIKGTFWVIGLIIKGVVTLFQLIWDFLSAPFKMIGNAINWIGGLFGGGEKKPLSFDQSGNEDNTTPKFGGLVRNAAKGLNQSILAEQANMPSGANLVVANDSETILTKQQTANIAAGLQSKGQAGSTSHFSPQIIVTVNGGGNDLDFDALADKIMSKIESAYTSYKFGSVG
jgi:hypothetical protein